MKRKLPKDARLLTASKTKKMRRTQYNTSVLDSQSVTDPNGVTYAVQLLLANEEPTEAFVDLKQQRKDVQRARGSSGRVPRTPPESGLPRTRRCCAFWP